MNEINHGPFTVTHFNELATRSIGAWSAVPDADWGSPAATLEWSRFETADHTIDCVFSYAFFLASRAQDAYPAFGEVHAMDGATPRDLVDGLRAVTNLLAAAVMTASARESLDHTVGPRFATQSWHEIPPLRWILVPSACFARPRVRRAATPALVGRGCSC